MLGRSTDVVVATVRHRLYGDNEPVLRLLFGVVVLLFALSTANVANLVLVRVLNRRRELATRVALGATQRTLAAELVLENAMLAAAAAVAGLVAAAWSAAALVRVRPTNLSGIEGASLGTQGVVFGTLLALVAAILVSVPAAAVVTRGSLRNAMGQSGAVGATPAARRTRSALVIAQLSIAVILLTTSTLVLESMYRLTRIDTGFERHGLVTSRLLLSADQYPSKESRRALVRELVERVGSVPGVRSVSVGPPPLVGGHGPSFTEGWNSIFAYRDSTRPGAPGRDVWVKYVDERYLETFSIRAVAGRGFAPSDDRSAPSVALVNESAARLFFPASPAMGRSIAQLPQSISAGRSIEVVGILPDVRQRDITIAAFPEIWLPLRQQDDAYDDVYVTARTVRDVDALAATMRHTLESLGVRFSPGDVSTMDGVVRRTLAPQRFILVALEGFAATAVVLAALGLYALLAYVTATRAREIGVRMALGARAADLRWQVMRSGLTLGATGTVLGLLVAYPLAQVMTPFLHRVDPHDPLAFGAAAAILLAAAMIGTYTPARHATTVDPLIALRSE